jgi:hypothetical protein
LSVRTCSLPPNPQVQFGDAIAEFGVFGRERGLIYFVEQPQVEEPILLIAQRGELSVQFRELLLTLRLTLACAGAQYLQEPIPARRHPGS